METMTILPGEEVKEFAPGLFAEFVTYIDRCEKTTRTYVCNLRQFFAWLKYSNIQNPQRHDVIAFKDWLSTEHDAIRLDLRTGGYATRTDSTGAPLRIICKPATVKAYLQSIRAFFKWTAANGYYPNIAENIHSPKVTTGHKKDSLSAEEVLAIEQSITAHAEQRSAAAADAVKDTSGRIQRSTEQGKRIYAMYLLAVNAGLRTVELSRANVCDIETKNGKTWIYIWGKGHSEADQKKALAPEVGVAIADYLKSRSDKPTGGSPLFISTGNRSGGKRLAPTTISTMLKRAMQEAGFDSPRLTAHSLRHSTAQNVMQLTGENIFLTQQYLRHSSPSTTEIYLAQGSEEQDAAIAKQLYDYYHGTQRTDKDKLQSVIDGLSSDKLEQLTLIAEAMK